MNKKEQTRRLICLFALWFGVLFWSLGYQDYKQVLAAELTCENGDEIVEAENQFVQDISLRIDSDFEMRNMSLSSKDGTDMATNEFIELIEKYIQVIAWEHKVNASALLAEAIIQADSGNSQLAKAPNYNIFATEGRYEGQYITLDNKEYKKYPNYKAAITEYVEQLIISAKNDGIKLDDNTSYAKVSSYIASQKDDTSLYQKQMDELVNENELKKYDEKPNDSIKDEVDSAVDSYESEENVYTTKQLSGDYADEGVLFPNHAFSNKELLDDSELVSAHTSAKSIAGDFKINKEMGDGDAD